MAGGLFGLDDADALFSFNVKCVVFSLMLMIAFALAPRRSYWVMALIPLATVALMFAYHKLYVCKTPIGATWLTAVVLASLALMAAYWFSPARTRTEPIAYFFIFVYGYVGMAFYDHVFRCSIPLATGLVSLSAVFKPRKVAASP